MTEDEMVGWHNRLNGYDFRWAPGVGDGQGCLACYGSWGCKESDMTECLNRTEQAKLFISRHIYICILGIHVDVL